MNFKMEKSNFRQKRQKEIRFKALLLLAAISGASLTMPAQVTIGSDVEPVGGAALDIKQQQKDDGSANSTLGLALPRVNLTDLNKLYPMFTGTYNAGEGPKHTGLTVYNVNDSRCARICPGIYVWKGAEWVKLGKPCQLKCGAYVAAGQWKEFMCHNLGADTTLDPCTPAKGLNGDYYQWGRKDPVATIETPAGSIIGWNTTGAPDDAWMDASKAPDDPCPTGYRVPTRAEWAGVLNNALNPQSDPDGANWAEDEANFSSGRKFGPSLYLPAAGNRRYYGGGPLTNRGHTGYYWSSTQNGGTSYSMRLYSDGSSPNNNHYRTYGFSVRCIAE